MIEKKIIKNLKNIEIKILSLKKNTKFIYSLIFTNKFFKNIY